MALGQVDARLDGDDVAGGERVLGQRRQPRPLVDLEPDAVPEAVAEVLAVARVGDQLARGRVDVLAARARANLAERALLGLVNELVDLGGVRRQRTGRERARAIGAV